jgi:signal transduction histidine kinase
MRLTPRTLQGRLTVISVLIVGLTLAIVSAALYWRLEDYFHQQEFVNLGSRTSSVANIMKVFMERRAGRAAVVATDGTLNSGVAELLNDPEFIQSVTNGVAQGDLTIRIGRDRTAVDAPSMFVATSGATFSAHLTKAPESGQARDDIGRTDHFSVDDNPLFPWALEVTISNPYTYRASTIAAITGLLAVTALFALVLAVVVAAILARRFTTPLRRLTEATTALAAGDLSRRVPADLARTGAAEITELTQQFNAMAARLEESVEVIRRDRDRSRDFLADVSHELRTPISALRTFNELLREGARDDEAARTEFLEASAQQLERLDWLAQNLLELSKLDSGLVLLDLRPDDLRAAVESSVEQALPGARRRGVSVSLKLPGRPVRIRHDPQRLGQVVTNLVGNALKFTPRGGSVTVELQPTREGAQIVVQDTGVGIEADELPRIFDRFYRGSKVAEARGAGSGLGLAIVKSVVDMHSGRVSVVSRPGQGSTFTVAVPRDPRVADAADKTRSPVMSGATMEAALKGAVRESLAGPVDEPRDGRNPKRTRDEASDVAISSPADESKLNTQPSG